MMQAIEKDGTKRPAEPFSAKKVKTLLRDPEIKEVRVFRLQKGMKINIGGNLYKITAARPNGKLTLKPCS